MSNSRIDVYEYKTPKDLMRVTVKIVNGVIEDIGIAGDFFTYPEDTIFMLENRLRGLRADPSYIDGVVEDFLGSFVVESIGSSVEDFKTAILHAIKEAVRCARLRRSKGSDIRDP